jgi:hypothetical protein
MGCVTVHKIIGLFAEAKPGAIIGNAPASVKHKKAAPPGDLKNRRAGEFEKILNPEQQ